MQKDTLERFVSKYSLNSAADSVIWNTTKKTLGTRFISADGNILGEVKTTDVGFEDGDYAIFDTSILRAMMGVLDDNIQVKVNKINDAAKSLELKDKSTKTTFVLADPSVIPTVPDIKQLPDFDIEIVLDSKFMQTFVKAKNALPEVETFTVVTTKNKTKVILGYSESQNTNRISFQIELQDGDGMDRDVSFSARYLKEILLANKEAKGGILKISSKGLAYVTFDIEGFTCEYYLVEILLS